MNNYYFTGVFEPDFNVSGIVEADSESDARRKVRELGYLVNQVQLLCDEPVRQEDCDVETDDMSGSAFPAEALMNDIVVSYLVSESTGKCAPTQDLGTQHENIGY